MTILMLLVAAGSGGLSALLAVRAVPHRSGRRSRPHLAMALLGALLVPGLLGVLFVRGKMTAALHGDFKLELSPIELVLQPDTPRSRGACAAHR